MRKFLAFTCITYVLDAVGRTFNDIVVMANNGMMPVSMKFSSCIIDPNSTDGRHICELASTHLHILADNIHIGNAFYSPGDLLIIYGPALFAVSAALSAYIILKRLFE